MEKSVKIKEDLYKKLNSLVGELRMREKKPVSISDALSELLLEKEKAKVSDFAGSWSMREQEFERIKQDLDRAWKTLKID